MKTALPVIILLFLSISCFSVEWSYNDILKYPCGSETGDLYLKDYHSIDFSEEALILKGPDSRILTETIEVEEGYFISDFFIHFSKNSSEAYLIAEVWDENQEKLIGTFHIKETGRQSVRIPASSEVFLVFRTDDEETEISLFSYGYVRKEARMTERDYIVVYPPFFYQNKKLEIHLFTRLPSIADIIIFDHQGNLVDYILQQEVIPEGENSFEWVLNDEIRITASGKYHVYFKFRSADGSVQEYVKGFYFIDSNLR